MRKLTAGIVIKLLIAASCAITSELAVSQAAPTVTITRHQATSNWECQSEQGVRISGHAEQKEAEERCINEAFKDRQAKLVSPAKYRITVTVPATTPPPANQPPQISGSPPTSAQVGVLYTFTPTAGDQDGNAITFSIVGRPAWATFSPATGTLTGTPTAAGTHSGITLSVSDGQASASLPAFSINVSQPPVSSGTTRVNWTRPTQREDASPLPQGEIGGYYVYYGTSPDAINQLVPALPTELTKVLVLPRAPHYFQITAFDTMGEESRRTNVVSGMPQ